MRWTRVSGGKLLHYSHLNLEAKGYGFDYGPDRSRNAEFIDDMVADPVFADMLSEPEDSSHQSHGHGDATPSSHDHAHSHAHQSHADSHGHGHGHSSSQQNGESSTQGQRDMAQDKVRSTLRSFVRDWSKEGAEERRNCYEPCLDALEKRYPASGPGTRDRGDVRVLVPGCGLGRLAMEVAARGEGVFL